ncbi:MAG: hypothetical protein IPL57_13445 [Rubrivivax sp.]|nr:hypothetical protein [Rubrivivax sp.]
MDRERMERCLEQVKAYQDSGMKAKAWGEANGVPLRALSSWCAHAQRWQVRLQGEGVPVPAPKGGGFVAARVPAPTAATVRIEVQAGSARVELHWPIANARELAVWLREVGR